jgi:hypothetical protein
MTIRMDIERYRVMTVLFIVSPISVSVLCSTIMWDTYCHTSHEIALDLGLACIVVVLRASDNDE